jgi:hypothetical protein
MFSLRFRNVDSGIIDILLLRILNTLSRGIDENGSPCRLKIKFFFASRLKMYDFVLPVSHKFDCRPVLTPPANPVHAMDSTPVGGSRCWTNPKLQHCVHCANRYYLMHENDWWKSSSKLWMVNGRKHMVTQLSGCFPADVQPKDKGKSEDCKCWFQIGFYILF